MQFRDVTSKYAFAKSINSSFLRRIVMMYPSHIAVNKQPKMIGRAQDKDAEVSCNKNVIKRIKTT